MGIRMALVMHPLFKTNEQAHTMGVNKMLRVYLFFFFLINLRKIGITFCRNIRLTKCPSH